MTRNLHAGVSQQLEVGSDKAGGFFQKRRNNRSTWGGGSPRPGGLRERERPRDTKNSFHRASRSTKQPLASQGFCWGQPTKTHPYLDVLSVAIGSPTSEVDFAKTPSAIVHTRFGLGFLSLLGPWCCCIDSATKVLYDWFVAGSLVQSEVQDKPHRYGRVLWVESGRRFSGNRPDSFLVGLPLGAQLIASERSVCCAQQAKTEQMERKGELKVELNCATRWCKLHMYGGSLQTDRATRSSCCLRSDLCLQTILVWVRLSFTTCNALPLVQSFSIGFRVSAGSSGSSCGCGCRIRLLRTDSS